MGKTYCLVVLLLLHSVYGCKNKDDQKNPEATGENEVAIYAFGLRDNQQNQGVVVVKAIQTFKKEIIIESSLYRFNSKDSVAVLSVGREYLTNLITKTNLPSQNTIKEYTDDYFSKKAKYRDKIELTNEQLQKFLNNENVYFGYNYKSGNIMFRMFPVAVAQNGIGIKNALIGAIGGIVVGSLTGMAAAGVMTVSAPFTLGALALVGLGVVGVQLYNGGPSNLGIPLLGEFETIAFGAGEILNETHGLTSAINNALNGNKYQNPIPYPQGWKGFIGPLSSEIQKLLNKVPGTPQLPKIPTGWMWGDPHVTTADGLHVEYHAVGEFINAKSTQDNFEIQTRMQPYLNTEFASINTAIGIQTGGDIVSIHAKPLEIFINNQSQNVKARIALKSNAYIEPLSTDPNSFNIVTSNKDLIVVNVTTSGYLNYTMYLQENRKGKIVGLVGNFDGNPNNDLRIKDGAIVENNWFGLYPKYSDSWRVSNGFLLHYKNGENSETFTRRDLPKRRADIESAKWNEAVNTCKKAGVIEEPFLSNCAFDLTLTNDVNFISSALNAQKSSGVNENTFLSKDLSLFSNIVLTSTMGQQTLTDSCLLSYTTGEVFQLKDGAKYASKVDALLSSYCGLDLSVPASGKVNGGIIGKLIIDQKWSVYKTGQARLGDGDAGRFDQIYSYKWANIVNNEDIVSLGDYRLNANDNAYSIRVADFVECGVPSIINTGRLYIFITQEGKRGVFRIKSMSLRGKTSKLVIDIKVQK